MLLVVGCGSVLLAGGISGFGGCSARRGRPRRLLIGGCVMVGQKHPVRGPLGLPKLDCLERVVEVVSLVLVAPTDSTSEVLDEGKNVSLLALQYAEGDKKHKQITIIIGSHFKKHNMHVVLISLTFLRPSGLVSYYL